VHLSVTDTTMTAPVAPNIRALIHDNGDLDSELTGESDIQSPEKFFDDGSEIAGIQSLLLDNEMKCGGFYVVLRDLVFLFLHQALPFNVLSVFTQIKLKQRLLRNGRIERFQYFNYLNEHR
jgi:hypothetical protein